MGDKKLYGVKLIRCCYCSAQSTLGRGAQRLVCHGCGAPIRVIEHVAPPVSRKPKSRTGAKPAIPHPAERPHAHLAKDRPSRRKKGKRKARSIWSRIGDAFDDIDDLFDLDDIFD